MSQEKSISFSLDTLRALAVREAKSLPILKGHQLQSEVELDQNQEVIGVRVLAVPEEVKA